MHRILLIAALAQVLTLPALAQSASSGEGNIDSRTPGAYGSTGVNNISALIGGPAGVATARSGGYDSSTQAVLSYSGFSPKDYASVSECLTAAYAAGESLGQCER